MTNNGIDLTCRFCQQTFWHTKRLTRGGRYKRYCSQECQIAAGNKRTSEWMKQHPEVSRAASTKWYWRNPAKRDKNRKRSGGVTASEFNRALERQHYRCFGCLCPIARNRDTHSDHNHKTGTARGLLCRSCNAVLGYAKETPSTLRRLMAYLDRNPKKTLVYLAGALKNKRIPIIGNALRNFGYDVMDEWYTPGEAADTNWQAYEKLRGRSYKDALRGRAATNIFLFDRSYLDMADIVIFLAPAGKSAMLELGYAKGHGKPVYILLDGADPDRYDVMPNAADKIFQTKEELLWYMKQQHPANFYES